MSNKNSSILLIDDDAEIRYSLDRVFTQEGHHVVAADSGEQGIQTAKELNPALSFWITAWEESQESKLSNTLELLLLIPWSS